MKIKLRGIDFAFVVLFCSLTMTACTTKNTLPKKELSIETTSGKTVNLFAEIARTAEEHSHGFMGRKKIPDGTGMLFVFQRDQILQFWMKNTPTPLSIAYMDSEGRIRDIFDMTPYSLEDITSTVSVRFALEVPRGWFNRAGIRKGDKLVLDF